MAAHGIDTPQQQAAFLGQIGIESGQLRPVSENLYGGVVSTASHGQ